MTGSWFLLAVFLSLSVFYYFSQKAKIKREARRERFEEKQQELVERLQQRRRDESDE